MIIISAMGNNRVIGSGEGMPWSVPEEFDQFLRFVEGQTVIMGRRSWSIFGDQLTSAHNVVVSRSVPELAGATVVDSITTAVETARGFGKSVFSAGGAQVYEHTLPLADSMYLSFIKGEFTGDAYFPAFDESEWAVKRREDHAAFEFVVYERK